MSAGPGGEVPSPVPAPRARPPALQSEAAREQEYQGTKIINVSERYTLEVPDRHFPEKDWDKLIWKTRHREPRDDEEITKPPFRPY